MREGVATCRGLQCFSEPRSNGFWSATCPLSQVGHCAARGSRAHHRADQLADWPRSHQSGPRARTISMMSPSAAARSKRFVLATCWPRAPDNGRALSLIFGGLPSCRSCLVEAGIYSTRLRLMLTPEIRPTIDSRTNSDLLCTHCTKHARSLQYNYRRRPQRGAVAQCYLCCCVHGCNSLQLQLVIHVCAGRN